MLTNSLLIIALLPLSGAQYSSENKSEIQDSNAKEMNSVSRDPDFAKMPLLASPDERNTEQEKEFIQNLRTAIKEHSSEKVMALYYLKNASPSFLKYLPGLVESMLNVDLENTVITIEPDNFAEKFRLRFTVPYLGKVVLKTTSQYENSSMGIPVGIYKGRYYLTLAADAPDGY